MSDPLNIAPRRIVPLTGPILWSAGELAPNESMIPLGAEHAAELAGAAGPRVEALAAELRGRLDHGRGFALLRGLAVPGDAGAPLRALAGRIGQVVDPAPATGSRHVEACDALLLRVAEPVTARLRSAARVHNELLREDRAGLAALYEARGEPAVPVFSVAGGVFAGRWDDAALPEDRLPAAIGAALGSALELGLRAGDILAFNPFLVWVDRLPGAAVTAVREDPSRLDGGGFAALR